MSVVLGSATLRNFRESVLRSAAGLADDDDDDDTKELDVGLDINQAATNEQAYLTRKVLAVSWLLQLKIYLKVAKARAVRRLCTCTSPAQRSTHNCHAPKRHRTEEVQLGQRARQGLHWLHC